MLLQRRIARGGCQVQMEFASQADVATGVAKAVRFAFFADLLAHVFQPGVQRRLGQAAHHAGLQNAAQGIDVAC